MVLKDSISKERISFSTNSIYIYTCGPTVYDYAHIGNMRPSIIASLLTSVFANLLNKKTFNYQNITDIDDKIIARSRKQNITPQKIAKKYFDHYLEIIDKLELESFNWEKVTNNLSCIEKYITLLKVKGFTTETTDSINFNVVKNKNKYGKLVPIKVVDDKANFAVWKKIDNTKEGYKSKHGTGRPGWHTECAAIINKIIGEGQIDVHISGKEIKFPHNENENVQHQTLFNKSISKCWINVGNVRYKNEKMSKSLGNIVLAEKVLDSFSPKVIKLWFFTTKYNNDIIYSEESIISAKKQFDEWIRVLRNTALIIIANGKDPNYNKDTLDEKITEALFDDLNTPIIISRLNKLALEMKKNIKTFYTSNKINNLEDDFNKLFVALNFLFNASKENIQVSSEDVSLFKKWRIELGNKNWGSGDDLRGKLIKKKVLI